MCLFIAHFDIIFFNPVVEVLVSTVVAFNEYLGDISGIFHNSRLSLLRDMFNTSRTEE